ncbi:hypothetical protein ACQ4PT_068640 [Festuca glaucescens]
MGASSVDKLCEILSKLLEQQQQLQPNPEAFKHALEPNPIKLSGPGNYISWAHHARLILSSHGHDDLLTADENVKEKGSANKQVNDRVLVWLLGSMEPSVREQVETMTSVAEVWSSLETQFAGKSNKMQANRIMHELVNLKQHSRSVTEYAGEMKRLYRDLHYYHPFEPLDKKDLAIHHKWFEPIVSKIFLDGLDEKINLRRQLIFSNPAWPPLEDIVASVLEEETRLNGENGDNQKSEDARAAMSLQSLHTSSRGVYDDKNNWFCDYCKKKGHTKEKCFKLHGFPPNWQKGRSKQGGALGGKWKQANHTSPAGEVPVVDVQALEEFKSKLKLSECSSSSQDSSKADSSFFVTSQGAGDRETTWDWDRA